MKKIFTVFTVLLVFLSINSAARASSLKLQHEKNKEAITGQIEFLKEASVELGEISTDLDRSLEQLQLKLDIQDHVQGRWLIYGKAGERIIEAAEQARGSIIIMARMFDIESGPLMEEFAETLVRKAENGTEVIVILSKKFPINYFHQVNMHAAEYFKNTAVQLELVEFSGYFNRDLKHYNRPSRDRYINSSIMLVDGVDLIGGTYILSHSDLTTGQSNIIQLRGPGVYEKVKKPIETVFSRLDIQSPLNERAARRALTDRTVQWAPVSNFRFYLGVYTPPVLAELYEKARHSVQILSHRPSRSSSRVLAQALKPLLEKSDSVRKTEFFYQEKGMGPPRYLNVVDLVLDGGYDVYKFNEKQTQYHRAGLIDKTHFYTGTVELNLIYVRGLSLQTMVTGSSQQLGAELARWIDQRRENAIAVHEKIDRFILTTPRGELTAEQASVRDFIIKQVMPALRDEDLSTLISLLDDSSAESIAKMYLYRLHRREDVAVDHYREFFERLNLDPDADRLGSITPPQSGRAFLELIAEELIYDHPPAIEVFNRRFTNHFKRMLLELPDIVIVDEKTGYRLHQPELIPIDSDFEWTLRIARNADSWQLQLAH